MTPLNLQDDLIEELGSIFAPLLYKTPAGERVPINIYAQHLPIPDTDDDEDPVPYLIVRLQSGDDDGGRDSSNVVSVVIIAGIWDDSSQAQGHRDVMNIVQKIYQRFAEEPNLKNRAAFTGDFHWQTQEDNYYPYFFGACSMKFNIAAIRREDPYA